MKRHMVQGSGKHIYKTVVVIWLTLSIASVVLAAVNWVQLSARLAAAREAAAIHEELDRILKLLLDAESGQRGFAITGDETFLEPFKESLARLPASFESLTELSRTDSEMLRQVMELRVQAELNLNFQRKAVEIRRNNGLYQTAELIRNKEGKKIMDGIRRQTARLHGLRSDLISDNGAAARFQLLRASLTSLVAGIIGIGAGVFAFWLSRVTLEQQKRERELVEAKLQAEHSNQEKTVFLANMSHEIRTPMNAVLGFSELLESELRDPRHRHYLQSIRTSAASLLLLINDILDMSKIEAGAVELNPEPTDPREICNFIHTMFTELAAKKGVKLTCQIAEDLPRALLLDRIRLRQILVNLVGNAVKFTDRGNIYIRVLWEKQAASSHITLILEVQDSGVGIPQDKLEAIFKPFVQSGAHREKEKQGSGLGLSIVKRLTEMMGGTVTAVSVPGQGSAFHLRFTDVAISARLPAAEPLPASGEVNFNELRAATLLVVDDNETNCQLVAGMFSGSHHRLFFGSSGEEAVSKARELRPDAILLDIRMPGMDGREALVEIRKIPGLELTPVIAVTASALMREEKDLKDFFSGYVRKPFSRRELFDELAQFIPLQPKDAAVAPAPVAGAVETDAAAAATTAPELIEYLRKLLTGEWPALADSLAINETKAFAARLERAAQKWGCRQLLAYAQTLAHAAENYAVVSLEIELQQFPALVERLESNPPAAT